jgi:hypothetical protein
VIKAVPGQRLDRGLGGVRVMALEYGLDRPEPPQAGERLVEVREADRWRRLSSNHSATVSSGADALAMPR